MMDKQPVRRAREEAEFIIERAKLPAVYALQARRVREEFWPKLRRAWAELPFAADLAAAYYAARDPKTPMVAKASLIAALFYFVVPVDLVPDGALGAGRVDDMMVLSTLIGLCAAHIKDQHRTLATQVIPT